MPRMIMATISWVLRILKFFFSVSRLIMILVFVFTFYIRRRTSNSFGRYTWISKRKYKRRILKKKGFLRISTSLLKIKCNWSVPSFQHIAVFVEITLLLFIYFYLMVNRFSRVCFKKQNFEFKDRPKNNKERKIYRNKEKRSIWIWSK